MSSNNLIIRNGIFISAGIILYFFIMKISGLEGNSELRFLNFVFVFWGINNAIKSNIIRNGETLYVRNLAIGIGTSALAVGITVVGLIVYVSFINPNFIEVMRDSFLWTGNITLPLLVFALLIEGIASSVISSFILMQYYKNYQPSKAENLNSAAIEE